MISLIRSFFQSKLGVGLTLAFLALIAVAFAASDITGAGFGGVAGGDRAATVGDETIGTGALSQAVSNAFEGERQQNPTLTMQRFVASGAIPQVLDSMIDRAAIFAFGEDVGIVASDALIGSELAKIPAFLGPDGRFNEGIYRQALAQQRLTDAQVRDDIAQGLVAKQVLVPVAFGAIVPAELARRYGELSRERRKGAIGFVPAEAFAPKAPPSDAALTGYYRANAARYTQPERRTIRYAAFGDDAVKDARGPTDAEIQQAYAADRAKYAPSETRSITQVIVPTEAAARALAAEVAGGKALDAAARAKGLLPSQAALTREALADRSSPAVAQAVFAAAQGTVAAPARSGLGWHVARVDAVTRNPGKTLAEARPELVEQLTAKLRREALADFTARIEEELDGGGKLSDVAGELGVSPQTTAAITADGRVFGKPGESVPAELARIVPTVFLMESEGQAQLAEVVPGKRFVVFEAASIVPAAPPPLAQIRDRVAADWARAQGAAAAKAAADKAIAAIARGAALPEALRAAGVAGAQTEPIDASRQQVAASGRVAPPLALMFSMAERTTKKLEAPNDRGWFVIRLDNIEPGRLAANDPLVAALGRELGQVTGREYAEQFRRALRKEVGVERNPAAVRAVRERLVGGGG
ncbi:MAG: SurA N-terminal domain-containing protein [Novosphingobium sp.]|nr:SurA N-terminal domain-containing protein [Novosphingobium sp.]